MQNLQNNNKLCFCHAHLIILVKHTSQCLHKLILEWTTQYFMSHGTMLLHFVSGLVKDSQLKLSGNMPAKQDSKTSKIE